MQDTFINQTENQCMFEIKMKVERIELRDTYLLLKYKDIKRRYLSMKSLEPKVGCYKENLNKVMLLFVDLNVQLCLYAKF